MDKKHLQTRPTEPRLRKKYVIWYVAAVLCILSIVLGLIFTIPRMNTAQRKSTPIAQATSQPQATGLVLPHKPPTPTPTPDPQHRPGSSIFPGLLFTPSSPWNMPIGTNVQLDPNSSAMARQLASGYHIPSMFEFGMPIYISTASDPLYSIYTDQDTFVANNPFHIPNTAAPALGVDKWLFVYDTTKQMIFEMWEAQKNGKTWTTQTGEVFSPTGDGVHQVSGAETSGNGASYFGGVIRAADIQRGYINHALSFASSFTATTWRYPMARSDGHGTSASSLPMGARIQLDPSVNCNTLPGAPVGEKMVCQALETYGGYIRDSAGDGVALTMYFEGEDLNDPTRNPPNGSPGNTGRRAGVFGKVGLNEQQELTHIPWNRLRVLKSWNSFTPATANAWPAPSPASLSTLLPTLDPACCDRKRNLNRVA